MTDSAAKVGDSTRLQPAASNPEAVNLSQQVQAWFEPTKIAASAGSTTENPTTVKSTDTSGGVVPNLTLTDSFGAGFKQGLMNPFQMASQSPSGDSAAFVTGRIAGGVTDATAVGAVALAVAAGVFGPDEVVGAVAGAAGVVADAVGGAASTAAKLFAADSPYTPAMKAAQDGLFKELGDNSISVEKFLTQWSHVSNEVRDFGEETLERF